MVKSGIITHEDCVVTGGSVGITFPKYIEVVLPDSRVMIAIQKEGPELNAGDKVTVKEYSGCSILRIE
jgi:hypothetical protein